MADIRVIFKNADGFDQEHSPTQDSVQLFSFKTANKELTDVKLSHLIDGADAIDEHIHDGRYYRQNQHIATSTGSADAGKPINSASNGKIDQSLINVVALNPTLNHSVLLNLGADDHPQYLKTDGTRDITGVQKYSTLPSFTDDKSVITKKYVDDAIFTATMGQEFFNSAITRIITPPPSPSVGARYLIDAALGSPTGVWAGKANQVAQWNGTGYTYQIPTVGSFIAIDNETSVLYMFGGTSWTTRSFEVTTASTGIVKNGVDLQLDPASAGDGLGYTAGVYKVNVDSIGIETNADTLRIKALGVKAANIDFGLGASQVNGSSVPLADVGNFFATDTAEAALQYLGNESVNRGGFYTAGAGGITKGQLVYISGADTVSPLSNLGNNAACIGLAQNTVAAGGQVKVLNNDTFLLGVLSGASAGTRYYWTGSAYSTSQSIALGANVWSVGTAKNATDLVVGAEFIKKNTLL